jgi:hypothetical protein
MQGSEIRCCDRIEALNIQVGFAPVHYTAGQINNKNPRSYTQLRGFFRFPALNLLGNKVS